MFSWQPVKWVQYAVVGVGLPYVAAAWLSTDSLVGDISHRAALVAGDWAKVKVEGRDVTIAGTAPSPDAAKAAAEAIATTYGVRTVDMAQVQIAPLAAPTEEPAKVESDAAPEIKGTWPEGIAKTLDVTVNGKTYSLGKDPELTSSGGNWVLKLGSPLPPGSYDVASSVGDGSRTAAAEKPVQLVVNEPPKPVAAPTLNPITPEPGKPVMLSGTWAVGTGSTLSVTVNGKTAQLGRDFSLLSSTDGKWTLKPAEDLAPGHYDVTVTNTDAKGQAQEIKGSFEIAAPPPPPPPSPPKPVTAATLDPVETQPVTLTGKWPAMSGAQLSVTVNGKTAELGKDLSLLTDTSGKWRLKAGDDLPPGHYDVTVTVTPNDGGTPLETKGGFDIAPPAVAQPVPAPVPAAPTVETASSTSDKPVVKGTWPEGNGNKLQVELDGVTHELGKDADLTSDGAGHWTLTPDKPVVNGAYDVIAKVVTPDGQSNVTAGKQAITVAVEAPTPPPPPAVINCDEVLGRIAAVFPVRFEFNKDDLGGAYPEAVNQYAALMKDPRCGELKIQVAGHADYIGSESYNQGLSERRAKMVIDALEKAGIDASRLSSVGYGKTKPLDPAHSDGARAKNRRVEFTVQK
ncbi:OmpA family protein [Aestuariivirga litoralis]|uniref:OmpA family protein n=1 Tax=Aestuariivirga litoralis TaxID=2650924 RepID=UPI0018C76D84|nr:OmpA family protein [Aestuariivirga litoralis]MBG1231673.1 OmpA family protein [Aestuariivirga litoralis]